MLDRCPLSLSDYRLSRTQDKLAADAPHSRILWRSGAAALSQAARVPVDLTEPSSSGGSEAGSPPGAMRGPGAADQELIDDSIDDRLVDADPPLRLCMYAWVLIPGGWAVARRGELSAAPAAGGAGRWVAA